jgi:hypothetical protein
MDIADCKFTLADNAFLDTTTVHIAVGTVYLGEFNVREFDIKTTNQVESEAPKAQIILAFGHVEWYIQHRDI